MEYIDHLYPLEYIDYLDPVEYIDHLKYRSLYIPYQSPAEKVGG